MPVAAFSPSRIHTDYSEWTAPGIAYNGYVWAWNNTTGKYEPTALSFDPAGTAAAAISTHLAAGNPHSQYLLAGGVSAFGATLIDDADAATARATLGLVIGTSANNIVQLNGSGQLPAVDGSLLTGISGGGGGGTPGGSTTQVQFNSAGAFAGDAGMTYDAANDRLTVAGGLVAPSMRPASDSTTALQWQRAAGGTFLVGDTVNLRLGIGGSPGAALDVIKTGAAMRISYSSTRYLEFVTAADGSVAANINNQNGYLTKFYFGGAPTTAIEIPHTLGLAFVNPGVAIYSLLKWDQTSSTFAARNAADSADVAMRVSTLRAASLRLDVTPTSETITPTHTITISVNGTNYKIPCVAA